MPHYKFDQIAFNITDKKMPEPGDEKMYIGLEHLDSGSLKVNRWGSEVELTGQKLVMKKGDILFGRRNTYLRRAAIAPHDGIFSAHGMIFRPKTDVIDPEYFPFFISSNYFMDAAIRISVGSLSPTVNWKTLKELEFDIPSLEEQRKNAALLASINETKEAYQELLLQTDNLVKSQFIEMFGDPESVINNAINTVADVADVQVGLVIKPTRFYSADGTGTPAFRSLNIGEMYIRDSEWVYFTDKGMVENQRTIAHTGDVLVVRSGYPGTSCVVTPEYDGRNVVDLIIAHPNVSKILPEFLCAFTNYPHGKIQIENSQRGVAQKHFNVSLYNKMKIVVPPMELQKQFVQLLHQSDKSKFELKEAIKSCDALMKAILFTNLEEKED